MVWLVSYDRFPVLSNSLGRNVWPPSHDEWAYCRHAILHERNSLRPHNIHKILNMRRKSAVYRSCVTDEPDLGSITRRVNGRLSAIYCFKGKLDAQLKSASNVCKGIQGHISVAV
jgi:hypothetical protein